MISFVSSEKLDTKKLSELEWRAVKVPSVI